MLLPCGCYASPRHAGLPVPQPHVHGCHTGQVPTCEATYRGLFGAVLTINSASDGKLELGVHVRDCSSASHPGMYIT